MTTLKHKDLYRSLLELWNRKEFKLTVFVLGCKGLSGADTLNPFVKVVFGKQTLETKPVKGTTEPEFHELFFHTFNNIHTGGSVVFEVWSAKFGKALFCGQASLDLIRLVPDAMYDFVLDLKPKTREGRRSSLTNKLSSMRGSSHDTVTGSIHVRMVMSNLSGHRPRAGPAMLTYEYFYDGIDFKTGDVIAYSGVGMVSSLTKLISNSEFSSIGLVLILPNLYTQRLEPYVVEVSPNNDGMVDAFAERPKKAVCIFRLYERLHQFHGGSIVHFPLKEDIDETGAHKMMAWIRQVHSRGGLSLDLQAVQVAFIKRELGFKVEKPEIQAELCELSSTLFVARCLALANKIPSETLTMINGLPAFVLCLSCFAQPQLVRRWVRSEAEILSSDPYPIEQDGVAAFNASGAAIPVLDKSPKSGRASGGAGVGGGAAAATASSLHVEALKRSQKRAADIANSGAVDEPLTQKQPMAMTRQASTLNYQPEMTIAPGEADLLTVDVDALISDLRDVSFGIEGGDGSDYDVDSREQSGGASRGDSEEDDVDDDDDDQDVATNSNGTSGYGDSPMTSSATQAFTESDIMNLDMAVATLDLGNIDLSLLDAVAPETLVLNNATTLNPLAQNVLNLVNYLPGMELVRFSAGALSVDQASALIRYKHEVCGGIFWSYEDFKGAVEDLALSMNVFDSFGSKAPFAPAILALLAPQVATRVKCEALFDQQSIASSLIDMISSAKSFVHFCCPTLTHLGIIAALALAVANGVEVRVLVGSTSGPAPVIEGAEVVVLDSVSFLSGWTPARKAELAQAGVSNEFLQLQDMSRRALNGRTFPVCLRRSLVVVDGTRSVVGSFHAVPQEKHDCVISMTGTSGARLVQEAFLSLWFCVGGRFFDHKTARYNPVAESVPESQLRDEMALYLSFPGNPCNLLQKHVLEGLAFSKGSMLIEAPHFTETAIHGQLKSLGRSRLKDIRIVTSADESALSGRLLRSYNGAVIEKGLGLFDYNARPQNCSLVVATGCLFCGSYSFTHRPDFDAAVLVRGGSNVATRVAAIINQDANRSKKLDKADMNVKSGSVKVSPADLFL